MTRIIHDLHAWLRNKEARLMALRYDFDGLDMPDYMLDDDQRAKLAEAQGYVKQAEQAVREALAITPVFDVEAIHE